MTSVGLLRICLIFSFENMATSTNLDLRDDQSITPVQMNSCPRPSPNYLLKTHVSVVGCLRILDP